MQPGEHDRNLVIASPILLFKRLRALDPPVGTGYRPAAARHMASW
jgi:hypothetical protein